MLRLEFERRKIGFSQAELAKHCGVHAPDICKIETGRIVRPYPTHLKRLSDFFGIPGEELLREVE